MRELRLADKMPFGKHVGEEVEDIIYDDPSYMSWIYNEGIVELDIDVIKILEEEKLI